MVFLWKAGITMKSTDHKIKKKDWVLEQKLDVKIVNQSWIFGWLAKVDKKDGTTKEILVDVNN